MIRLTPSSQPAARIDVRTSLALDRLQWIVVGLSLAWTIVSPYI
jgi:hypothetical protein